MELYCYQCGRKRVFNSLSAITDHCKSKEGHACAQECKPCKRLFVKQIFLDQHVSAVHQWKCIPCDLFYADEAKLAAHHDSTHNYPCVSCPGQRFPSADALDMHNRASHAHRCAACKMDFYTEKSIADHVARVHGFKCGQCRSKTFYAVAALQAHVQALHGSRCEKCSLGFRTAELLAQHEETSHQLLPCGWCPAVFDCGAAREAHVAAVHFQTGRRSVAVRSVLSPMMMLKIDRGVLRDLRAAAAAAAAATAASGR
ncbi:uncharacterized protein L3040_002216 [Drepanopeziza brunnea f. sp. 'multigermtubi']|uniref:Zinc finger Y-chromosomal protein n=1 Tax=Marssonina brunnea f. sp. multigermtubi (strain MB_m1) TaxID=1072389 RepID=K1Y4N8_MARBU|nr:zinc finger Y-chromosomal protein [Drepanopeziza brunnea f. sp. 'multigermtubi' MB_m1]EKD20109.1 zinc finger Y-chromosomal protein [Drepanopeziza brunnea f. sp. 'multigermtubi' MB_m1]KAJ5050333.1 hypothetical protein L3040_002216 [Drepanopeziza brunnea f. sp. 'multigermtubi']